MKFTTECKELEFTAEGEIIAPDRIENVSWLVGIGGNDAEVSFGRADVLGKGLVSVIGLAGKEYTGVDKDVVTLIYKLDEEAHIRLFELFHLSHLSMQGHEEFDDFEPIHLFEHLVDHISNDSFKAFARTQHTH